MKYRKKPVVVEAFQWFGDNRQTEDPEWIVRAIKMEQLRLILLTDVIKQFQSLK